MNGYLRPKAPLLGYIRPALANRLQDDDDDGDEDCHIDDDVDHGKNNGFDSTSNLIRIYDVAYPYGVGGDTLLDR